MSSANANRPRIGASYDKGALRRIMEPGLTAFGQQAGGTLGSALGSGVGKGLMKGAEGMFADTSARPADKIAHANAYMQQLEKDLENKLITQEEFNAQTQQLNQVVREAIRFQFEATMDQ